MNRYWGPVSEPSLCNAAGERVSIAVPLLPRRCRGRVDIAVLLAGGAPPMGTVESTYGPAFYCRRHADFVEYMSYKRASSVDKIE